MMYTKEIVLNWELKEWIQQPNQGKWDLRDCYQKPRQLFDYHLYNNVP